MVMVVEVVANGNGGGGMHAVSHNGFLIPL
jgi:hypothetical protein